MTQLQLALLRINELERQLLTGNYEERISALEKFQKGVRDGELGFYPSKKYEKLHDKIDKLALKRFTFKSNEKVKVQTRSRKKWRLD